MSKQRISKLIFHELSLPFGWGNQEIRNLDLAKIINVSYRRRLFCLLQQDRPYTLCIDYKHKTTSTGVAPVIVAGGRAGMSFYEKTDNEIVITCRGTLDEITSEHNEIMKKMKRLDIVSEHMRQQALRGFGTINDIDQLSDGKLSNQVLFNATVTTKTPATI